MPYGIIQCYLPPGRGDIPAFTPAEAGTRFSDPGGTQGWVDLGGWLEMVYPHNSHPSWTNRARCWLTSLMRPTTLTTTPNRHPTDTVMQCGLLVINALQILWRWWWWKADTGRRAGMALWQADFVQLFHLQVATIRSWLPIQQKKRMIHLICKASSLRW